MWRAMVVRGLRSCHEILGLTPQASKEELKLRYHELARSLHPDVCPTGTSKSRESFAELAEAYATCLRLTRSSASSASSASSSSSSSVLWPPRWMKPQPQPSRSPPGERSPQGFGRWRIWGPGLGSNPSTGSKSYQGQPWKWRIKGPLTISAQRKAKGFLRR
ncbi:dnaJ [Symbiodinium sp. KB8]|nr:dnaJ [Symbiodinium sp. KB8]